MASGSELLRPTSTGEDQLAYRFDTLSGHHGGVLVRLRNPSRELTMEGPVQVAVLLDRLEVNRESVLVIRNGEIVAGDTTISDDDTVELRPVISGG